MSSFDRLLAGITSHDELGQHRVEVAADSIAFYEAGIPAHTGAGRNTKFFDGTRCWHEGTPCIFAVDAELEGMTPQLGALRIDFLAAGNAELFAHQINARYFLGNRVLNLQAGVHL